jgi:hypothetical protein
MTCQFQEVEGERRGMLWEHELKWYSTVIILHGNHSYQPAKDANHSPGDIDRIGAFGRRWPQR